MGTDPFDNLIDLPLGEGEDRSREAEPSPGDPAPRPEIPESPPPAPPPRRQKVAWWPALLLLIAIAGALGWYFYSTQRNPAVMRVEPALVDLGSIAVGSSGEASNVTLKNDGGRAFTVSDLASGSPSALIDGDECRGRRLEPGASCVLALRLRPAEAGRLSGRLTISATAANSPLEVPWVGTGTAPRAELEPSAVAFGETEVGQTGSPRTLTVRNSGIGPLMVREVLLEGTAAGAFQREQDGCRGVQLAPGASCRVELSFAPRVAGSQEASLRLLSDSAEAVPLVWLSGSGVIGARLRFVADDLDFGIHTLGAPAARRELTVVHEGRAAGVDIEAVALAEGDAPFEILEDGCRGQQLASGERCVVSVAFSPSAAGSQETPLRLLLRDDREGPWIPLRGVGAPPMLETEPSGAVDFGEQAIDSGPSESRRIAFTNGGEGALPLAPLGLRGDDRAAFRVVDDGCGERVLAPGERCAVRVRFLPTAEGVSEARLMQEAADNSGIADLNLAVVLRGVGAAAALRVEPTRLDLGSVATGEAAGATLRLSNPGRAPLAIESSDVVGEGFSVDRADCPSSLPAGASCVWQVRFKSRRPGTAGGRLEIASNAGNRQVPLTAEVRTPPKPEVAVQPARLDFGGQPVGERGEILDVVIRNPGTGRLVLEPMRLEAGDFRLVPGSCEGAPFVAPGADCTVGVRFLPTAAGPRSARLRISHNAGAALIVMIAGEGL
ncbi:MAG: choice-of-anchor D domain-containing protein [Acidobacteriota bacterium]